MIISIDTSKGTFSIEGLSHGDLYIWFGESNDDRSPAVARVDATELLVAVKTLVDLASGNSDSDGA